MPDLSIISIWFTKSKDSTVVWMADSERPFNGKGSKVSLQQHGDMVLQAVDGSVIWTINTSFTDADRVELLESGNLVLKDINLAFYGKLEALHTNHPLQRQENWILYLDQEFLLLGTLAYILMMNMC